jgi:hypothetical protein
MYPFYPFLSETSKKIKRDTQTGVPKFSNALIVNALLDDLQKNAEYRKQILQ